MAEIHARAMTMPAPWAAPTLSGFLSAPGAVLVHEGAAFALGRVIADEAELLTIAVDPDMQGRGLGRACLSAFEAAATARGATRAFLDVAATNATARHLYRSAGYDEDGVRPGYYSAPDGERVDAILMSKALLTA